MSTIQQPIVVGASRSADADAALRWALQEAGARNVPVLLIRTYPSSAPHRWDVIYGDTRDAHAKFSQRSAETLLENHAAAAASLAPGVDVTSVAVGGNTVPTLVAASRDATLVVLGSRDLKGVGSALLGSVGIGVGARARCPVVVVRGPAGLPAKRPSVVVGVDGTDDSDPALEFGFDHASRHGLPLEAVLCWRPDLNASMQRQSEQPVPADVEQRLSSVVSRWRDKYPDVRAHDVVVRDHPVTGLVTASAAQHLLVVGSRRRHALAGTLLGSVSQAVLHEATCPVAVIPVAAS